MGSVCVHTYVHMYVVTLNVCTVVFVSRLTVVIRKAKEEVPCDDLSTNAHEYFTRTNLKNSITDGPNMLVLYYSS